MFCKNCGAQIPDGARFCPECGTPAVSSGPVNQTAQETYTGGGFSTDYSADYNTDYAQDQTADINSSYASDYASDFGQNEASGYESDYSGSYRQSDSFATSYSDDGNGPGYDDSRYAQPGRNNYNTGRGGQNAGQRNNRSSNTRNNNYNNSYDNNYNNNNYGNQGGYGYQDAPLSGLCVAGFIVSLASIFFNAFFLAPSIVGIILSACGRSQCKNKGYRGNGLGVAGLVISIITLILYVLAIIYLIFFAYNSAYGLMYILRNLFD